MSIGEIKYWASLFRAGAEKAHRQGLFKTQPFNDFPNACCGDAPELLAQFLTENYDSNSKYKCVYGVFRYDDFENIFGHSWLVVNDCDIVDITSDQRQFKDARIFPQNAWVPCFVGRRSDFHSLFEIEPLQSKDFHGIDTMGRDTYLRLKTLYDTITQSIE